MKIYHISTVHERTDERILKKECISLVKAGFDVSFVIADGKGNEEKSGVKIIDAGNINGNRIKRFFKGIKLVRKIIRQDKPDVVHFHDPELLLLVIFFAKKTIMIYDSHENLPKQILSKPHLYAWIRKPVAKLAAWFEKIAARKIYGIISVTEEIVERFKKYNPNAILIRNYPVLESFEDIDWNLKNGDIIYAGGITEIRGALEMAKIANSLKKTIHFYGPVYPQALQQEMINLGGEFVKFYGFIDQDELFSICHKASFGLILLHPVPNYINSSPNKLFEYMLNGMVVIASDFLVWKEVVEKYDCGVCIDPFNVNGAVNIINELLANPEKMKKMGENGRKAVESYFTWECESKTLIDFYKNIILK